jgi:hypothetical protein
MSLNVAPLLVETCHCREVVPFAAAVKLVVVPAQAVAFAGCVVTMGVVLTVSVAAVVVTDPQPLLNTARKRLLLSVAAVVKLYGLAVAPAMSVKVMPSLETCHWIAVALFEVALKVAVVPVQTAPLVGLVATVGNGFTVTTVGCEVALQPFVVTVTV